METSFRSCWRESKDFDRLKPALRTKSKSSQLPELVEETSLNNVVVGRAVPSAPRCVRWAVSQIKSNNCVIWHLWSLLRVTGGAFMSESKTAVEDDVATWV